jgi:uncharacterized protein (TIGR00290 family)
VSRRPRALLSWSSGKDSAFALGELRAAGEVDVVGLVTTVNRTAGRVAMHAVRDQLLDLQAEAVGLPVRRVNIPSPCPNDVYEAAMAEAVAEAWDQGITHMAFGDLFLADIRAYREERLQESGLTPLFPLWGRETGALARRMIAAGIRAILTCVDPSQLDRRHAGSSFDALLAELPAGCDPCGERGEFHTFAWDGPGFSHPVPVSVGEVVERDGFVFADLLPA